MRAKVIVPSFLLGILITFIAWSVLWCMQGKYDQTYGLSDNSYTFINVSGSSTEKSSDRVVGNLARIVEHHHSVIIIDTSGSSYPALDVIDPAHQVTWLSRYASNLTPRKRAQAILIEGTYCHQQWQKTGACPLVSDNTDVIGTISLPVRVGLVQYIRIPSRNEMPRAGIYMTVSHDEAVLEITDLLHSSGFSALVRRDWPFLVELALNPLFAMSSMICVGGLVMAIVYWSFAHRRRTAEWAIRYGAGATNTRILREGCIKNAASLCLSVCCGSIFLACAVSIASHSGLEVYEYVCVGLGAVVGCLVVALLYAVTLMHVLRVTIKKVRHE